MRTSILALALATGLACSKPAAEPVAEQAEKQSAEQAAKPTAETHAAVVPSGKTREEQADGLVLIIPEEWERGPARSTMRKAEFVLPGAGGEVRMILYRFAGGAGSAAQNIERWKAQIEPKPSSEAKTDEIEANGLKITSLDMAGKFLGQRMPGAPEQPPVDDGRLLAASIEGAGDAYYLKLVGPAATIDVWVPAWNEMLAKLAPAK